MINLTWLIQRQSKEEWEKKLKRQIGVFVRLGCIHFLKFGNSEPLMVFSVGQRYSGTLIWQVHLEWIGRGKTEVRDSLDIQWPKQETKGPWKRR